MRAEGLQAFQLITMQIVRESERKREDRVGVVDVVVASPSCITSYAGKSAISIVNFTFYKNWISQPSDHEALHNEENDRLQLQLLVVGPHVCELRAVRCESESAINAAKQALAFLCSRTLARGESNELSVMTDRRSEMFCNRFHAKLRSNSRTATVLVSCNASPPAMYMRRFFLLRRCSLRRERFPPNSARFKRPSPRVTQPTHCASDFYINLQSLFIR